MNPPRRRRAAAAGAISANEIALRFKGRALRPKVESVLAGLLRMGIITQAARGTYHLTRAACERADRAPSEPTPGVPPKELVPPKSKTSPIKSLKNGADGQD